MPWGDWQFWLVTLIALIALILMVRPIISAGSLRRRGIRSSSKAHLTVEGRQLNRSQRSSEHD